MYFFQIGLSAYEVKNNCCLFERLFRVKKNGVFLFGISFFVLGMFTFLNNANEESGVIIGGSTKTAQARILKECSILSELLKTTFFISNQGFTNRHMIVSKSMSV